MLFPLGVVEQGEVQDQVVDPSSTNQASLDTEESDDDSQDYQGPITRSRAKGKMALLKANLLMDRYFDTSVEELEDTKSMCILQ